MYAYIDGLIIKVEPTGIVLETNNIGYYILTPNPYLFKVGEHNRVYIYHLVRQDNEAFYGFINEDSKKLFIKLLSVSGIGPKSALSILATNKINDVVVAIENADVKYLTKFPGIGNKSAQQIILDLKGKLVHIESDELIERNNDVELALQSLGYSNKDIKAVIKKLDLTLSTDMLVKEALKLLMK